MEIICFGEDYFLKKKNIPVDISSFNMSLRISALLVSPLSIVCCWLLSNTLSCRGSWVGFFFSPKQELILHFIFFLLLLKLSYHFPSLVLKNHAVLMYNHSSYKPEIKKLGFAVFTICASITSLQYKKWRNVKCSVPGK